MVPFHRSRSSNRFNFCNKIVLRAKSGFRPFKLAEITFSRRTEAMRPLISARLTMVPAPLIEEGIGLGPALSWVLGLRAHFVQTKLHISAARNPESKRTKAQV
jgi:hypothetical protein